MNRFRGVVYGAIIVLASVGFLSLFAQVGSPGGATVGIGINREGFQVCWRRADGVTCQNYEVGPCAACHDLKPNANFDAKTETTHRVKYWGQYQLNLAPGQGVPFGGVSIKLVTGNYAAFNKVGKRLATFPVGTRILKDKNDGLWIFFPPKPQFILSSELEEAIKRGLPSLK